MAGLRACLQAMQPQHVCEPTLGMVFVSGIADHMHADHQLHKLHAALMQSAPAAGSGTLHKAAHSCQHPEGSSLTNTTVAGMHTGVAAPLSLVQLPHTCTVTSATVIPAHTCSQLLTRPPTHTDQVSALLNASTHAAIRLACMTLTVQV